MSQAGINNQDIMPPAVPQQFTADDATISVPVANNLNVFSRQTFDNNDNLIQTTADPNGDDDFYVELTNRFGDTVTTTDATLTTVSTVTFGTAGTYLIEAYIVGYNTDDTLGASYRIFVGVITDGAATVTKLNTEDKIVNEQAGMTACNVTVSTSGNDVLIQVTGLGTPDKTINWKSSGSYIFVGA